MLTIRGRSLTSAKKRGLNAVLRSTTFLLWQPHPRRLQHGAWAPQAHFINQEGYLVPNLMSPHVKTLARRAQHQAMKYSARVLSAVMAYCLLIIPVHAAEECYTRAEFEADQAMRLQAKLNVIAYSCQDTPGATPLRISYGNFIKNNQKLFLDWQSKIINYLKKHEKGQTKELFDRYQSYISQEVAYKAIIISNEIFCDSLVPSFSKDVNMTTQQLVDLIKDLSQPRLSSHPLCMPLELSLPEPEIVVTGIKTFYHR